MINFVLNKKYVMMMFIGAIVSLISTTASAQCDFTLACNDLIQLSLGDNCEETVTPDMILEAADFPNEFYEVVVTDEAGNIIEDDIVNASHIGQTLTTQIILTFNNCNLSCWGSMIVEEKLPPLFTCPADVTIDCGDDISPDSLGNVTIMDAFDCSGVAGVRFVDAVETMPCSDMFSDIINRTWIATDVFGNESTCVQVISVIAADLDNVVFPEDFIINCEALAVPIEDLTPEITGRPSLVECSNIQNFFTDLEFPLCGAGFKVRREWHVIDWCTGQDTVDFQTIEIEDTQAPVVTCGLTFFDISSNNDACFATYNVPLPNFNPNAGINNIAPTVIFDCSEISFTIEYAPFPEDLACESIEEAAQILLDEDIELEFFPVMPNANGEYIIDELPIGCNWIRYTFSDDCGHVTTCTKDVFVVDAAPPSAICEGFTTVTVDAQGWAQLRASSLDDHSWDGCDGELTFTARRLDSECSNLPESNPDDLGFDEMLHFCCEDVGGIVEVELMVTDVSGNFNICQAAVFVDDKLPPIVTCPPAQLTLDCTEDFRDLSVTGGAPGFQDNCIADIFQEYDENLNDCGIGTVTIRHFISDNAGNEEICTQFVSVQNTDPLSLNDIDFPADIETFVCDEESLSPDALNSRPIINYSSPCADPAVSYSDLTFFDTEGACFKIVRTWTVVDWCADPVDFFNEAQAILVANTQGPIFTNCEDQSMQVDDNCEGTFNYLIEVSDDCTPTNLLDLTWTITDLSDNDIIEAGATRNINEVLSAGNYEVNIYAIDECDNEGHCSFEITIYDDATPTPICLTEVVWVLDENGSATVWASDFDQKSFDGCDEDAPLTFSFDEAGNIPNLSFNCDDIPDGVSKDTLLQMFVTDADGNTDFCQVTLILQDNGNDVCIDTMLTAFRLEGKVFDTDMSGVDNIDVQLTNMTVYEDDIYLTDNGGGYSFEELIQYDEYMVTPTRDVNPLNGVSTLDLVLIQKHILGQQAFTSPYQMIAADVNNSESITGIDLVELRKLILGVYDTFPKHTSWDFVSMNFGELELNNPWNYVNALDLGAVIEDKLDIDFVAVKIGDVNGNAVVSAFGEQEIDYRSGRSDDLILSVLNSDAHNVMNIQSENHDLVNGFQFALEIDQSLNLMDVQSSLNGFSSANWSYNAGVLVVSWNDIFAPDVIDLNLVFDHNISGKTKDIKLNEFLSSEAYDQNDEVIDLELKLRSDDDALEQVSLGQNVPNPFRDFTTIEMYIPEGQYAKLSISDMTGKNIYNDEVIFGKGHTQITINSEVFDNQPGVYFYTLEGETFKMTKKLFFIN